MDKSYLHSWPLDPVEAVKVHAALRIRLVLEWDGREVFWVWNKSPKITRTGTPFPSA